MFKSYRTFVDFCIHAKNLKYIVIIFTSFSTSSYILTLIRKLKNKKIESENLITEDEIREFQKKWADGVILIGNLYSHNEHYEAYAKFFVEDLYNTFPDVLFKPTKACVVPFRNTYEDTLSYFITGDIIEDTGFALEQWSDISFKNNKIYIQGNIATVMGEYTFKNDKTNKVITAEYTFGYLKCKQSNKLKIYLQHSSIPYKLDTDLFNIIRCM
tara:strand:+ start:1200 stop:1841 length:642 start_codon:yes stop_codon:yes gene_type:complete